MTYETQTHIFQLDAQNPDPDIIKAAADVLRVGRLVAFPTETVYGLGANALDAAAVQRVYAAKNRPAYNPLIVHIAAPEQLAQVAINVPPLAHTLATHFWPGPLTMVLPRHPQIPPQISAGRATVAVRLPAHPVAQALILAAGLPVVAPSANLFMRPSATSAQHVLDDLCGHVDVILDGGTTPVGVESTVLDMTNAAPKVLRPGGVTLEMLREVIPDVTLHDSHAVPEVDAPASPGMLLKHYSPNAEMLLLEGDYDAVTARMQQCIAERLAAGQRVGVLVTDEEMALFKALQANLQARPTTLALQSLGSRDDLGQAAQNLFSALRVLDERGMDVIIARQFAPEGLGRALADRLLRAAEGRVLQVTV